MQPPNEPMPGDSPQDPPSPPPAPIPSPDGQPLPAESSATPSPPPPPPGTPKVDFNVISRAWALLQPTLGTWVIAFLIFLIVNSVLAGFFNMLASRMPFMRAGSLVSIVVTYFLIGGLYRMAIKQVRGHTPDINDLFSVIDVFSELLVASLLVGVATLIGFLLCILPGYLVMGLLLFAIPLVVDKRMAAVPAITASLDTLKPEAAMAFIFALVVGLIGASGALLCGIGLLVTGPLALLSIALLYNDYFPETAPAPAPTPTP